MREHAFTHWISLVILCFALAIVFIPTSTGGLFAQASITERIIGEQGTDYNLSFAYPQIGIPAADGSMEDWVQELANSFKDSLAHRQLEEPPYSAQLTYSVEANAEDMVVILFRYSIYTGGAHPGHVQTAFNFLVPDGARVYLPDLIGSDGITHVSDLAIAGLTAQLTGPNRQLYVDWISTGAGPYADNFETFEWLPDQIVLKFNEYQVASYADGPQEVRIPRARLQDILRPDPRAPLPSFDCADARTAVEHAICSDMTLAQLDRRTAEAFNARLRFEATANQPPVVRAQQQAWLAQRDAACAGGTDAALITCLEGEYSHRLTSLQNFQ